MYYDHPAESKAYKYNNQYYFGTELIIAPVVSKIKKSLSMAKPMFGFPKGVGRISLAAESIREARSYL